MAADEMMKSVFEDISSVTSVLTIIAVFITTIFLTTRAYSLWCRGPGPWGVPVLGFYPFLRRDFYAHLAELGQKYGDVYLLSMCGKLYVHIGSVKALREAFTTKNDCFQERSPDFSLLNYIFYDGLPFISDEAWKVWRKFLVQGMRELGIGPKEQLKGPFLDSIQATLEKLRNSKGQPVDIGALLTYQCTDIVRRFILGKKISEETVLKLNELYLKCNLLIAERELLLTGNIARYLVLPWNKEFKQTSKAKKELDDMLYEILNDHKANFDSNCPEDLMDLYLREKKTREEKNDPQAKLFTDKTLIATLEQVYGDGGTTIGAFIAYFFKELAKRVDVQNAIYEEIIREIGTERLPIYEDRSKLPFTNSVLKEIERTALFFPVIPSLESRRDTTISNVFVPKGTVTIINFYAIHHDPSVYEAPQRFDPERFMPDENTKRLKAELPVTFGIGKRSCAGESLVMINVFMFVTSIIQNFTLSLEETNKTNDQPKQGAEVLAVLDYKFLAIPRKDSSSHFI